MNVHLRGHWVAPVHSVWRLPVINFEPPATAALFCPIPGQKRPLWWPRS